MGRQARTDTRVGLMADGKLVTEKYSGGTSSMRYFITDHLSSVAVVIAKGQAIVAAQHGRGTLTAVCEKE